MLNTQRIATWSNSSSQRSHPCQRVLTLQARQQVVTGASSGLSLKVTRQLLQLQASTVILAVRNIAQGEACVKDLLRGQKIQQRNLSATIRLMELDADRKAAFIKSPAGLEVQTTIWAEALAEMKRLVNLPLEMQRPCISFETQFQALI
ncbi:hypothetical protein PENANT_c047G02331 [Penicillium antarcticum]|uniref:Ketoreductase (KR) domain-containing protein n=1 Tax=Penicillium antarcticum TaxID=416450 RepID=A0A1V6PT06_9EURO|nr:hypothetical protein PENANT_c047G02331 [Penicillium antarcticum]